MHILRSLAAQACGLLLAAAVARVFHLHGAWVFAALQAPAAALCSRLLRQPPWWQYLHLAFVPAALLLFALQVPPWIYLAAALLLGLVFWGTVKGDVPLFLSSRHVCTRLENIVATEQAELFIDLGAGTGSVAVPLAENHPELRVEAWEVAPIPWAICKWRSRRLANLRLYRMSFWECDLSVYDVVYAFLSPAVMQRLGEKALREMRPGALLVSSSFPVPEWEPETAIEIEDRMATSLYCYRIPQCHA